MKAEILKPRSDVLKENGIKTKEFKADIFHQSNYTLHICENQCKNVKKCISHFVLFVDNAFN